MRKNFAEGTLTQLLSEYRTLLIVGFVLFIFALVPGLPTLSLGFMALVFLSLGYLTKQVKEGKIDITTVKKANQVPQLHLKVEQVGQRQRLLRKAKKKFSKKKSARLTIYSKLKF